MKKMMKGLLRRFSRIVCPVTKNKKGMEMVQVAILVAIAVTLGLIFKAQIGDFVDKTFSSLDDATF